MNQVAPDIREKSLWWQTLILLLSIYAVIALAVDTFISLPDQTSNLINSIDTLICIVFIGDFLYRLVSASKKRSYLKWGWIDLVSSIPSIQFLRWGRAVRIVRILRILRGLRSSRAVLRHFFREKALGVFATVGIAALFLLIFSSIAILSVEDDPESTVRTGSDALWWAFVTLTNVGDGRYYPVTGPGKIIAALLTLSGAALLGTFTAYIASKFLGAQQEKQGQVEAEVQSHVEKASKDMQ